MISLKACTCYSEHEPRGMRFMWGTLATHIHTYRPCTIFIYGRVWKDIKLYEQSPHCYGQWCAQGRKREEYTWTWTVLCSAVILIMAPDSRVQYSEPHAGRQVVRQAGTVSTKSGFNMQNLIQLKKWEKRVTAKVNVVVDKIKSHFHFHNTFPVAQYSPLSLSRSRSLVSFQEQAQFNKLKSGRWQEEAGKRTDRMRTYKTEWNGTERNEMEWPWPRV